MSLVALGPEIHVSGRPGSAPSSATASGTVCTTCSARTTQTCRSQQRQRPTALVRPGIEHDRAPVSAFVHARADLQPVALRRGRRSAAVAAAPGVRLTEVPVPSLESDAGAVAGRALAALPAAERPDAVVAVTDVLGMAVLNELVAAGISVPADVAVMGCDHNSSAWGSAVPLTSVTMEGGAMGEAAVGLLLDELTHSAHHEHTTTTLEPHLVARESTVGRR